MFTINASFYLSQILLQYLIVFSSSELTSRYLNCILRIVVVWQLRTCTPMHTLLQLRIGWNFLTGRIRLIIMKIHTYGDMKPSRLIDSVRPFLRKPIFQSFYTIKLTIFALKKQFSHIFWHLIQYLGLEFTIT